MDANRLIKWVVILGIIFFAWKYAIPWAKKQLQGHTTSAASDGSSCTAAAQRASEAWGSGLHSFVNPPYDLGAWNSFRTNVETKIAFAEAACKESSPSCDE